MTREMAELRAAWLAEEATREEIDRIRGEAEVAYANHDAAKYRVARAVVALRDSCIAEARRARAQLNTLPESP